jgi:hypothetical protein
LRSTKYGGNFIAAQASAPVFVGAQVAAKFQSLIGICRLSAGFQKPHPGIRDAPALTISPVADAVSETAAQPASDPKMTRRPAVRIMKPMIWIL